MKSLFFARGAYRVKLTISKQLDYNINAERKAGIHIKQNLVIHHHLSSPGVKSQRSC